MADITDVVIKKYTETHTNLEAVDYLFLEGQQVIVTDILNVTNRPHKIGDGAHTYKELPFSTIVSISVDTDYTLLVPWININENKVRITNTDEFDSIEITITLGTVTLQPKTVAEFIKTDDLWAVSVVFDQQVDLLVHYTDLDYGYDAASGGTTIPTIPTFGAVVPVYTGISIEWNVQTNLTNFKEYQIQVSDDSGSTWYSLETDGTDYKDVLDAWTTITINTFIHVNIPFGGTQANPTGISLRYRVRRVTKEPLNSNWTETSDITTLTVNSGTIQSDSIYADTIRTSAVTAIKINALAVTTEKLDALAVTAEKIDTNTITANEIAANTITAAEITADTITAAEIAVDTITATEIATNTITTTEIAANTILASNIAANTITAAEIAANTIVAGNIVAATITTTEIAANTITGGNIAIDTITATEIDIDDLFAQTITIQPGGTITAGDAVLDEDGLAGTGYSLTSAGIEATVGSIGGWTIDATKISSGSAELRSEGSIYIGSNFSVDTSGNLTAANATLSGEISADTGAIGGWDITADTIETNVVGSGKIELSSSLARITIQSTGGTDKVAMGYLGGLIDPSDPPNLLVPGTYGFWIADGDDLVFYGDSEYYNGAMVFEEGANIVIQQASGNPKLVLGDIGIGDRGLAIYSDEIEADILLSMSDKSSRGYIFSDVGLYIETTIGSIDITSPGIQLEATESALGIAFHGPMFNCNISDTYFTYGLASFQSIELKTGDHDSPVHALTIDNGARSPQVDVAAIGGDGEHIYIAADSSTGIVYIGPDVNISGDIITSGNISAGGAGTIATGEGSGSVAMTINDGQGNANLTFNHIDGIADVAGNVGRIIVNVDSTTGASMTFGLKSNAATGAVTSTSIVIITETDLKVLGNSVLTTADEGSGNGLDADTLDTIHASQFLRSDAADIKTSGHLTLNDNIYLRLGTGADFEFFNNGSHTYMDINNGQNLYIRDGNSSNALRFTFDADLGDLTVSNDVYANQFRSNIATGSAPLIVASTTKVTNLNVDRLDDAHKDTDGTLSGNSDSSIPTEKAVRTYVLTSNSIPTTHNLTSSNATKTLPTLTGRPQTISFYWTNGGTYKLTLAATGGKTVGGLSAGTWLGEGEGHMVVESDGSNWEVIEYEDSGNNSNGSWIKQKNGEFNIVGKHNEVSAAITIAQGNIFRSNAFTVNFTQVTSITLVGVPIVIVTVENPSVWICGGGIDSTTQWSFMLFFANSITTTTLVNFNAVGRWRA